MVSEGNKMKELWKLPVPSTALLGGGVALEKRLGRAVALRYFLEGASGESTAEAIVFEGVESFKCTYGQACEDWMLVAYDRLVEVSGSAWVPQLAAQLQKKNVDASALRHLLIYLDDGPAYELICRSFRIESDRPA
jgi:hypothetical protein